MLAASMAGVYIKLLLVFDNVTSVGRPKDNGLFEKSLLKVKEGLKVTDFQICQNGTEIIEV